MDVWINGTEVVAQFSSLSRQVIVYGLAESDAQILALLALTRNHTYCIVFPSIHIPGLNVVQLLRRRGTMLLHNNAHSLSVHRHDYPRLSIPALGMLNHLSFKLRLGKGSSSGGGALALLVLVC